MIKIMYPRLFRIFEAARRHVLHPGEALFLTDMAVQDIFLVLEGEAQLVRHTRSGERLILHRAGPGAILAEASAYAPRYHCEAVVRERAEVAALPKPQFLAALAGDAELAADWATLLARATQTARLRAEIRSLPRVTARLDVWLEAGNTLPPRGQVQDVAAELGVTREALYRELSRRRAALH